MGQHDQAGAIFRQVVRDTDAQQDQGLCADNGNQPAAVNDIRVPRRVEK